MILCNFRIFHLQSFAFFCVPQYNSSTNSANRKMWETSMKGLVSLVRRTTPSSFAYLCEKMGSSFNDKVMFRHLYIFGESDMC